MISLPLETALYCALGIIMAFFKAYGNELKKKAANFFLKLVFVSYIIAVIVDPFLPFPNKPADIVQSFIINSFVALAFYIGYFSSYYLFRAKNKVEI